MAALESAEIEERADSETAQENLVKKSKTTSPVWNYFSVKADEKGIPISSELDELVCNLCSKGILAKRSNTTNLFSHLKEHHPDIYVEISPSTSSARPKSKQPSITECLSRNKPYDASSKRAKDITYAIMVYLTKDMQPFYTVEREAFRQLLQVLDPKYQLPTTIKKAFC